MVTPNRGVQEAERRDFISNMVDIGKNIKEELLHQERTVSWLARKLNCTRATVYRIFGKNSIDTALLAQISNILHHNFFDELRDEVQDHNE